ncbi:MAG: excinuclease ABC subunit UvrB [Bacteroidales bacterium]
MDFKLVSNFQPMGDQPEAIKQLVDGINQGLSGQVLLGVTGSGKTFTAANVISQLNRPTLVLSHNKTLAAQLYGEFKQFFPENRVEYFVSYYDYYQPEAFIPTTNTYIEKDLSINDEIEKLRLSTTSALLSGRRDVIVVSSVSCIYGIGNPEDFNKNVIRLAQGKSYSRNELLMRLVHSLYSRDDVEFSRGNFRVKGDTIDVYPAYLDEAFRLVFWDDELETIESFDPATGNFLESFDDISIYPANIFVTSKESVTEAIYNIQDDLNKHIKYYKSIGKHLEAKRVEDRVNYDLEMLRELGYCSGIENYSRYFDGRQPGMRPFCLLDYFPKDFMTIIDESHVTIPQIRAMYGGDLSRKKTLVEYGFRLPSALDNRPLKFEEFNGIVDQIIYLSATPADYELQESDGVFVEQVIRPTGIPDPPIEVRPSMNQIDDLLEEVNKTVEKNERILVTTLTKRMAEELTKYFTKLGIRSRYIHSDIATLERVEIMEDLRLGKFDVLIGVNLLREGLDLPEVSLVAILDADKEGFLRSERSLTQTVGRAARNINSKAIMYADKITNSMQRTIDETNRRREKQLDYNLKNNLIPKQIVKAKKSIINRASSSYNNLDSDYAANVAEDKNRYMSKSDIEKRIKEVRSKMELAVKELDFIVAAQLRDELFELKKKLD